MERQVPGCRPAVEELLRLGGMAGEAQQYAMSPDCDQKVMLEKYGDFLRMASSTTREGMEAIGMPKKAQDILETYWCYLGADADEMDFLTTCQMIYKYYYLKPGMPEMKSHALSLGLADSILKHDGDIWYNCEVSKILIEDGRAVGVIADGKELRADIRSRCIRLHTAHSKKLGDLSTKKHCLLTPTTGN